MSNRSSYLSDEHLHSNNTNTSSSMLPNLGGSNSRGNSRGENTSGGGGSRLLSGHLGNDMHISMHHQQHNNNPHHPSSAGSVSSISSWGDNNNNTTNTNAYDNNFDNNTSDLTISSSLVSQLTSNNPSSAHSHRHNMNTNLNNLTTNPNNLTNHHNNHTNMHNHLQNTPRLSSLPLPSASMNNMNTNTYSDTLPSARNGVFNNHSHSNLPTPIGTSRGNSNSNSSNNGHGHGPEVRTPLNSAGNMGYSLDLFQHHQQPLPSQQHNNNNNHHNQQHHQQLQQYPDEESEFYNHNTNKLTSSFAQLSTTNTNNNTNTTHLFDNHYNNNPTSSTNPNTNNTNTNTTVTSPFKRPILHKSRSQPMIATEDFDRMQDDTTTTMLGSGGMNGMLSMNRLPSLPINSPLDSSSIGSNNHHNNTLSLSSPGDMWHKSLPLPSLGSHGSNTGHSGNGHSNGGGLDVFSPTGVVGGIGTPGSMNSNTNTTMNTPLSGNKPFPFMKSKTAPRLHALSPLTLDTNMASSPTPAFLIGNLLSTTSNSGNKPFLKKLFPPNTTTNTNSNGSNSNLNTNTTRDRAGSQESVTNDDYYLNMNDSSSFCHAIIDAVLDNNTPVHQYHKTHVTTNQISPSEGQQQGHQANRRAFFDINSHSHSHEDNVDDELFYLIDENDPHHHQGGEGKEYEQDQKNGKQDYSYDFEEEEDYNYNNNQSSHQQHRLLSSL